MKIELTSVFALYVLVFLAIIMASWLIFAWKERKASLSGRRRYRCRCCDSQIDPGHALIVVRCQECGARSRIKQLTEIEP